MNAKKLLLCCGHNASVSGHEHEGWITVDQDVKRNPDLIMDLTNQSDLDQLSKQMSDQLNIVYVEGWNFRHPSFYQMVYQVLKPDGYFIFPLTRLLRLEQSLMITKQNLRDVGFNLNRVRLIDGLPFISFNGRKLVGNDFDKLSNYQIYAQICQMCRDGLLDKSQLVLYKINYITGRLSELLERIKQLYHIDPQLAQNLTFDDNYVSYLMIQK